MECTCYNIICYSFDITASAPSKIRLRRLLDSAVEPIGTICLKVYISKSCFIILKRDRVLNKPSSVKMLGQALKLVTKSKNMGDVLCKPVCIKIYVDLTADSFSKPFISIFVSSPMLISSYWGFCSEITFSTSTLFRTVHPE